MGAMLVGVFEAGVRGLTVSPTRGHGGETDRDTKVMMGLVQNIRIEIGVSDHFESRAVDAIVRSARTGGVGDGEIFVTDMSPVVRIRTGKRGMDAVTPVHPDLHTLSYPDAWGVRPTSELACLGMEPIRPIPGVPAISL
jgi:nitrogen regulatory protein PII